MNLRDPRLIVWMIGLALVFAFSMPDLWRLVRLTTSGERVEGRVVRTEPKNHRLVEYAFLVGTEEFRGAEQKWSLEVGEELWVSYLPENPAVSCIGVALSRLRGQLIDTLLMASVAPLVWVWAAHEFMKKKSPRT